MPSSAHLVQKRAKQRRRRALKVTIDFFLEGLVALCRPWSEGAIMKPYTYEIVKKNMRGKMFTAVTKHINEVCLLPNSGFACLIFIVNFYDDERGGICTKYRTNCKCYSPSQCIVRSQRLKVSPMQCCFHCSLIFQGKLYLSLSPKKPLFRHCFAISNWIS